MLKGGRGDGIMATGEVGPESVAAGGEFNGLSTGDYTQIKIRTIQVEMKIWSIETT